MARNARMSPVLLVTAVIVFIGCIGASFAVVSMFGGLQRTITERSQEKQSADAMEESIRRLVSEQKLGERPTFPDTPVGKMQSLAYGFLEKQVARQTLFDKRLKEIGFDWVMGPDSLRSKKNLEECVARIGQARDLAKWFYESQAGDYEQLRSEMQAIAKTDARALSFLKEFEQTTMGPAGSLTLTNKVRDQLAANHDALDKCVRFLLANSGKFDVQPDGAVVFHAGFSQSKIDEYNGYVNRTVATMNEINRLESLRVSQMNAAIGDLRQ